MKGASKAKPAAAKAAAAAKAKRAAAAAAAPNRPRSPSVDSMCSNSSPESSPVPRSGGGASCSSSNPNSCAFNILGAAPSEPQEPPPQPKPVQRQLTSFKSTRSVFTAEQDLKKIYHKHWMLWRFSICMGQDKVRHMYQHSVIQWTVAALISANFLQNCVEKQLDPWNELYPLTWSRMEFVFNVVFLIELVWNIYGSFYLTTFHGHFASSGWNLFDLIVVGFSVPSMLTFIGIFDASGLQALGMLRMLRAFRILRLFRRVESLNKIIISLGKAVPGLLNAGLVMVLVMCIYAILGTDLFGKIGVDGNIVNVNGENVSHVSLRGLGYGEEYYGSFSRSLYTLFQVLTGESWSELISRPVVFAEGNAAVGAVFHISFIVICGIILVNVVVAVLLDKMMEGIAPEDPLDREAEATELFKELDVDGGGSLDLEEFTSMATTEEQRDEMANYFHKLDGAFDGDGELSLKEFLKWIETSTHKLKDKQFEELLEAMRANVADTIKSKRKAKKQASRGISGRKSEGGGGDGQELSKLQMEVEHLRTQIEIGAEEARERHDLLTASLREEMRQMAAMVKATVLQAQSEQRKATAAEELKSSRRRRRRGDNNTTLTANGKSSFEDRVQDGAREASTQGPGREHTRSSTMSRSALDA